MNSKKTDEPFVRKHSSLFAWLTPSERKALIVVALLVLLGFVVKTLRGV